MPRPELHRTLVAAVEAVSPPPGSGLEVTHVDLDLPLEIVVGVRDGRPVVAGTAPHSRWTAGVLREAQISHLRIEAMEIPPPTPTTRRDGR
jgi:hypothetical protein